MKFILFSFFFILILLSVSQAQKTVSVADYERAVKYMDRNLSKLLYQIVMGGEWLGDDFVYKSRTAEGIKTFKYNRKTNQKSEVQTTSSTAVATNPKEFLSPNKKLAAYIYRNNLWVRNVETGKKTQLTFDGKKDYGYATNNAGWIKADNPVLLWSDNSDKIATFQQDSRKMGEMYLTTTNIGHPKLEQWKYEMPGDSAVFMIERVIIHLGKTPKVVRLKQPADFQRSTVTDHIAENDGTLLDAQFSADGKKFAYVSSSRDHKIAELKVANTATGSVETILKEEVATNFESGYNQANWLVLFDQNLVIWHSSRDNWDHLYLYDLRTKQLKNQITKGNWAVQQVKYIDKANQQIYFMAQGREAGNPYHHYYYRVNFDGSNLTNLTPEQGSHVVVPTADWSSFVDTYSTTTNPPVSVVKDKNGKVLFELAKADISQLTQFGYKPPIEFSVKARDGVTDLYGILYLPANYDKSKKYPVVNYIYPGPQIGSVYDYSYAPGKREHQAMAELGMAVYTLDAMGTPGRSKSFKDAYYGNMGDNGLPDQIAGLKQLAQQYSLDLDKVGIWGRSGGGFASCDAILRYPDFYKVAFSIAGNHDQRNYEADWGEKYHGLLKTLKDGSTNYDDQANQSMAKNLKGKLMLAHGGMDNNVPPYMTYLVVDALINANKDFDLLIFPNKAHRFGEQQDYLTRRMWDYFVKNLMNAEHPKEFLIK